MPAGRIAFEGVWKKFRRGEVHDSLRDLLPAMAGRLLRRHSPEALESHEFWALKDVSFEVRPGETLGIIGRNGAGKSTTLKLLTRILKPTLGRSIVQGRVGALIELAAGFHPDLTGRENVYLQGAIMGMRREETTARFEQIVDFAGVGAFIDTQVKRYSSGMQARLGFSVAAHLAPDVLLIDEVLAVGDLSFQQRCYARLDEYRRQGVAIAFVSHNMQAISRLCDRVLYLRPDAPPLCGPVGDMVAEYVSSDAHATDPRVADVRARLTRRGDRVPLSEPIEPTTTLQLSLDVTATEPLPNCGVEVRVHRSDGLLVFQSMSLTGSDGWRSLEAGDVLRTEVDLRANLLRGVFTVSAALLEKDRRWDRIDLGVVASFVVEETTHMDGIAELDTIYRLTRTDSRGSTGEVHS